jgi:hypothetical protein
MADAGVFIGFGFPARGKEQAATTVFRELMEFLGGQAQQGNLESFEPAFMQPHGGELGGFMLVRGDRSTLDAMVASDEFARLTMRAQLVVDHMGVVNVFLGGEIDKQMGMFLESAPDLSQ